MHFRTAILLAAVLSGCDAHPADDANTGAGIGGGLAGPGGGTASTAYADYESAACEAGKRCGYNDPSNACDVDPFLARDVEAGINDGRIVIDTSCLAAFQSGPCADVTVCLDRFDGFGALSGTVANGEACVISTDCAHGYCDTSSSCPGKCVAWVAPGSTTFSADACEFGTIGASSPYTCREQRGAGASCPGLGDCDVGLYCDGNAQCQPLLRLGDACGSLPWFLHPCGLYAICDPASGLCSSRVAAGQSCSTDSEDLCQFDDVCIANGGTSGTCQSHSGTPSGAGCEISSDCISGLACLPLNAAYTCQPMHALGQPCVAGGCVSGLYCDLTQTPGTCQTAKGAGSTCTAVFGECDGDLACLNAVCTRTRCHDSTP